MKQVKITAAKWLRAASVTLLTLGVAAVVHAQNAIESVTSSMQSGAEVIRVDLTQPPLGAITHERLLERVELHVGHGNQQQRQ